MEFRSPAPMNARDVLAIRLNSPATMPEYDASLSVLKLPAPIIDAVRGASPFAFASSKLFVPATIATYATTGASALRRTRLLEPAPIMLYCTSVMVLFCPATMAHPMALVSVFCSPAPMNVVCELTTRFWYPAMMALLLESRIRFCSPAPMIELSLDCVAPMVFSMVLSLPATIAAFEMLRDSAWTVLFSPAPTSAFATAPQMRLSTPATMALFWFPATSDVITLPCPAPMNELVVLEISFSSPATIALLLASCTVLFAPAPINALFAPNKPYRVVSMR